MSLPIGRPLLATAVAAALLALATPVAATTDSGLDQTVERDEAIGDEQVVVDRGHVDIGPRATDGPWQLLARDDTSAPPVWRTLEDLVFHLGDSAILPAPGDEQFDFIDAAPGADVHVVPQTQAPDVAWLGWNSQAPEIVDTLARGMTLRLHRVQGPGQVTVFLQSGNFDDAQLLWTSDEPAPQDIWADTNSHVHANWVFTEPGIYLLDVEVLGDLTDGTTAADRGTVRFAVGQDTDATEAFTATWAEDAPGGEDGSPTAEGAVGEDEDATEAPPSGGTGDVAGEDATAQAGNTEDDDGGSLPALAVGGGAVLLVLAGLVALSLARSRRARRLAADPLPTDLPSTEPRGGVSDE